MSDMLSQTHYETHQRVTSTPTNRAPASVPTTTATPQPEPRQNAAKYSIDTYAKIRATFGWTTVVPEGELYEMETIPVVDGDSPWLTLYKPVRLPPGAMALPGNVFGSPDARARALQAARPPQPAPAPAAPAPAPSSSPGAERQPTAAPGPWTRKGTRDPNAGKGRNGTKVSSTPNRPATHQFCGAIESLVWQGHSLDSAYRALESSDPELFGAGYVPKAELATVKLFCNPPPMDRNVQKVFGVPGVSPGE